jgi:prolipoprotein diacylglyceryltransferase
MSETLGSLFTLALAAAPLLTLMVATWVVGRCAERAALGAGLPRVAVADLTTPIFFTAVVAARLVDVLPTWRNVAANPLDLLRLAGAGQLSPVGGVLGAGAGLIIFTRRRGLPLLQTADIYGLALPLGFAVYGGGCLVRGDCYGGVAPAPFGIIFPGFELPHYPVGLYAAAGALFAYGFVRWFAERRRAPGAIVLVAVLAIAASDAILTPFRLERTSGLLDAQVAAIVAIALVMLVVAQSVAIFQVACGGIAGSGHARPIAVEGGDGDLP